MNLHVCSLYYRTTFDLYLLIIIQFQSILFKRRFWKRRKIWLAVVSLIVNKKFMYGVSLCINNSPLKLTPFNECKCHAFLQRHGLNPVAQDFSIGRCCINFRPGSLQPQKKKREGSQVHVLAHGSRHCQLSPQSFWNWLIISECNKLAAWIYAKRSAEDEVIYRVICKWLNYQLRAKRALMVLNSVNIFLALSWWYGTRLQRTVHGIYTSRISSMTKAIIHTKRKSSSSDGSGLK